MFRQALLALLRLDPVLLLSPSVGDEEPAMRALEALMAVGAAAQKLRREPLVAVRADDLVVAVGLGGLGHIFGG